MSCVRERARLCHHRWLLRVAHRGRRRGSVCASQQARCGRCVGVSDDAYRLGREEERGRMREERGGRDTERKGRRREREREGRGEEFQSIVGRAAVAQPVPSNDTT